MRDKTMNGYDAIELSHGFARDSYNAAERAACGLHTCVLAANRAEQRGSELLTAAETPAETIAIDAIIAAARFVSAAWSVNDDNDDAAAAMLRAIHAARLELPGFMITEFVR